MSENPDYRLVPAYDSDGNETGFYTREPDGVSGMSVTALADFCGTTQPVISALLNRLEQSDPISNEFSEQLKPFVGKDLRLISNDSQGIKIIPDEACYAIAEYYAFDARSYSGKEVAQQNYRMAGRAGMRVYIWSQTGYVPELLRDSLRSNTTTYIERLENIRDHEIDDERWSTFREGAEVLLLVEKEMGVPVDQMDLCDGSIGSHWSTYRQNKPWAMSVGTYRHVFRDQRGDQYPRAYDLSELSYFRRWLRDIYIPFHLPDYLAKKFGKMAAAEIYQSIGGMTDRVREVTRIVRPTAKQTRLYEEFTRLKQQLLRAQPDTEQQNLIEDSD